MTEEELRKYLDEVMARSTPKLFPPDFGDLVSVVEEELAACFTVRRFGTKEELPSQKQLDVAAVCIADGVDEAFRYEMKRRRQA